MATKAERGIEIYRRYEWFFSTLYKLNLAKEVTLIDSRDVAYWKYYWNDKW